MIRLFRFFLLFIVSALAVSHPAAAQGRFEIPRFTLSATAIGMLQAPDLYWLDFQIRPDGTEVREFRSLSPLLGNRGKAVEIPVRPPVKLYQKIQNDSIENQYQPFYTLPAPKAGDQLLLILHRQADGKGSVTLFDDSPLAHPPGTVRILNLTPERCAVSIGNRPTLVPGGENRLLGKPPAGPGGRFPFEIAARMPGSGADYKPPAKLLGLQSAEHRLLIVLGLFPTFKTGQQGETRLTGYELRPFRMYDRVERPEDNEENP